MPSGGSISSLTSSDFALRPDKTAVLLQVRSTKLSVSSRRNAHFHKTACSPHRLVASRLANLTVLMLFGATLGPRLPQQKRQFRTRLSLILFSLIRKRPQDPECCKTIVFYKPKSPSGSKASCFYTFLCGPKKMFFRGRQTVLRPSGRSSSQPSAT